MKTSMHSYLLVSLQFIFIFALLLRHGLHAPSSLALCIFSIGMGFGIYAMKYNTLSNFNITPEIKTNATLITTGAYRYVRHPMYFSVIMMMLGVVISRFNGLSLLLYSLLIVTLLQKAKKEEKLWVNYSKAYCDYQQKTKRIIPFML